MAKSPEEGEIWEWRAFGSISHELDARIQAHPIRMGIRDQSESDLYLISPTSDHNVKLRKSGDEALLKFKLLLVSKPGSIELYSESAKFFYGFPVSGEILEQAAGLLHTELPDIELSDDSSFDEDQLIDLLARTTPPVTTVEVSKSRSQFRFDNGWVELADVEFPRARMQTLSIHSAEIEAVRQILDELKPCSEIEAMNYVQACRKYGQA